MASKFLRTLTFLVGLVAFVTSPLFAETWTLPNGVDNVIIEADEGIQVCSGTGDVVLATGCGGAGTIYKVTLDATDGSLDVNDLVVTGEVDAEKIHVGATGISGTDNLVTLIQGADNSISGPVLAFAGDAVNQTNTGAIRFLETPTEFRGMYLKFDGSANQLHLGYSTALSQGEGGDVNLVSWQRQQTQTTFAGPVQVPAGTAAAPSVAFSSDADTGLYSLGANQLGVTTGGANVARFDSGGAELSGIRPDYAIITPAGSAQGDATAITAPWTLAGSFTAGQGVRLPADYLEGDLFIIFNGDTSDALALYPGSGDSIGASAANASVSIAAGAMAICVARSVADNNWRCGEMPGA